MIGRCRMRGGDGTTSKATSRRDVDDDGNDGAADGADSRRKLLQSQLQLQLRPCRPTYPPPPGELRPRVLAAGHSLRHGGGPATFVLLALSAFRSVLFALRSSASHLVNGKKSDGAKGSSNCKYPMCRLRQILLPAQQVFLFRLFFLSHSTPMCSLLSKLPVLALTRVYKASAPVINV